MCRNCARTNYHRKRERGQSAVCWTCWLPQRPGINTLRCMRFEAQEIVGKTRAQLGVARREIQMVFQDPYASLNPRHRIGDIIAAGPITSGVDRDEAYMRAEELLRVVGMDKNCMRRFPHQFSGGQRQRISIARALAMQPKLLIADEPVSALDVSVQAQVLALLREIRAEFGLSMLFITHDLRVASDLCDRIIVMQAGKIVEVGTAASICGSPKEAYTRELIAAIPGRGRSILLRPLSGNPAKLEIRI